MTTGEFTERLRHS